MLSQWVLVSGLWSSEYLLIQSSRYVFVYLIEWNKIMMNEWIPYMTLIEFVKNPFSWKQTTFDPWLIAILAKHVQSQETTDFSRSLVVYVNNTSTQVLPPPGNVMLFNFTGWYVNSFDKWHLSSSYSSKQVTWGRSLLHGKQIQDTTIEITELICNGHMLQESIYYSYTPTQFLVLWLALKYMAYWKCLMHSTYCAQTARGAFDTWSRAWTSHRLIHFFFTE